MTIHKQHVARMYVLVRHFPLIYTVLPVLVLQRPIVCVSAAAAVAVAVPLVTPTQARMLQLNHAQHTSG